jgi:hypothetical protein
VLRSKRNVKHFRANYALQTVIGFVETDGIMDIDSDSSVDMECTPPEVLEAAKNNSLNLLPAKSRDRYEFSYKQFMDCRNKKGIKSSFSENVLIAYIGELSEKLKPSSLWTQYSMFRSTLCVHHNEIFKIKSTVKT